MNEATAAAKRGGVLKPPQELGYSRILFRLATAGKSFS